MDKIFFEKFNIRFWLRYSTRGQFFSSIGPSASAKCKNAPSVIHCKKQSKRLKREQQTYCPFF